MPFINTKLSCELTEEKETVIKKKLGEAASLIGKSEGWLMVGFEDKCRLWFRGNKDGETAFVDVALYGGASSAQYDRMTAAITDIITSELPISANRVYVKYTECDTWGWSGNNF